MSTLYITDFISTWVTLTAVVVIIALSSHTAECNKLKPPSSVETVESHSVKLWEVELDKAGSEKVGHGGHFIKS